MRKLFLANLLPLPALGPRLWLTLAGLAIGGLNLVYLTEIWPHTPAAQSLLLKIEWLLLLALPPQVLWWAWRGLRASTGPGWLRGLATAVFLGGACLVLAGWVVLLLGGVGAALYGLENLRFAR
ncbi:MAG: hypothetical protein EOO59_04600 [Hymenobacter sp.]|nr:MAG: hypothetical protein EOO59_04600 [Hymenobacter sp.]